MNPHLEIALLVIACTLFEVDGLRREVGLLWWAGMLLTLIACATSLLMRFAP